MKRAEGFGAIELVLVVVVVAAAGLIGYNSYVARRNQNNVSPLSSESSVSYAINNAKDIDHAISILDKQNLYALSAQADKLDQDANAQ